MSLGRQSFITTSMYTGALGVVAVTVLIQDCLRYAVGYMFDSSNTALAVADKKASACIMYKYHVCVDQKWALLQGEHKALEAFRKDPFGCRGALLSKKEDRDPFAVGPYFGNRCPDMESLLSHCESIKQRGHKASMHLPWDSG